MSLNKKVIVGMGCRKDSGFEEVEGLFLSVLASNELTPKSVMAITSITLKKDEKALLRLGEEYGIPLIFYSAKQLLKAKGSFTSSDFVQRITGVDNVSERSAVLAGGGMLLVKKQSKAGVTMAVGELGKICIFGGTTEGRILAEQLAKAGWHPTLSVATSAGREQLTEQAGLTIHEGRLSLEEMKDFLQQGGFTKVIDATHPYAQLVTQNIRQVAEELGLDIRRLIRSTTDYAGCKVVGNTGEAVEVLEQTSGRILLAVGAKELSAYTALTDYQRRLYPRVLPVEESILACRQAGIPSKQIIALQGPFSQEMNHAICQQYDIQVMVTKDSGAEGGFGQKISAALDLGIQVVVIARPSEQGESLEEVLGEFGIHMPSEQKKRQITIIGAGPGAGELMTLKGQKAVQEADLVVGNARILEDFARGKESFPSYKAVEIRKYLEEHPQYRNIVVLFSGDIGFYSGAKKLYAELEGLADTTMEQVAGISAMAYLCSQRQRSWDGLSVVSLHGREGEFSTLLREKGEAFFLLGGEQTVEQFCQQLVRDGFGDWMVTVGERLSYPEERIEEFSASSCPNNPFGSLVSVLVEKNKG